MSWWQQLDASAFRWINTDLRHPWLDALMPFFAWNDFFVPAVLLAAIALIWKGGVRGRLLVAMLVLVIALGDSLLIATLKDTLGRSRPAATLADVHLLVGKGRSHSMPSSHASSWFAALLIGLVYYRRSWLLLLPIAVTVAFSRVYVGAHYPGDVLAGALLGAGYAAAGLWGAQWLWGRAGRACFPAWWARLPSLINPLPPGAPGTEHAATPAAPADAQRQWLNLGYCLISVVLLARLFYLASGEIQLSEDEAYQWLWSKHLDLSYYSKPLMIALAQFLGTTLWGDTELGVRFLSPVIGAGLGLMLLRFMARELNPRAAFCLVLTMLTTPLLAVGSTLMTVDPLLVLFWTAAMVTGWRAVQPDSNTRHWLLVGLWMGLGLLSKYTALLQLACWGVFFACHPPARQHLRRPGPYLAVVIVALCSLPILLWNARHDWITVQHVLVQNAEINKPWRFTFNYLIDFFSSEAGLLNPVFFVAMLWAMVAFWRSRYDTPLARYAFSMGAPVFLGYMLFTFHSRVIPNWIAPAIVPMLCLAAVYWDGRYHDGARAVKKWLVTGLTLGAVAVVIMHDTDLIKKIAGRPLPPKLDPLRRVRAWDETARVVATARRQLLAEGKEVFVIGSHYGIVGQLSFYLPEGKASVATTPLVYFRTTDAPHNQFYFWPGYHGHRTGQNALYVDETKQLESPPPSVLKEFESVTPMGLYEIKYKGRVLRKIQIFACRNLL